LTTNAAPPPLSAILDVASAAARDAGAILRDGHRSPKSVHFKGDIDLVTEYDLASERAIVDRITAMFPEHVILAEEGGPSGPDSPCRWYIDPLDGTTNFVHGFPVFSVSIAYEALTGSGPAIQVGVVFDPIRDEMFTAIAGQGAQLNGRPISVSERTDISQALVATGFPYDIHHNPEPVMSRFKRICLTARGVRRAGSAALDLSYVAAGRLDGFWEERLHPWDTAAGGLLVQEAGGQVTNFSLAPFRPQSKEILATNGGVHYTMAKIIRSELPGSVEEAASPREDHE